MVYAYLMVAMTIAAIMYLRSLIQPVKNFIRFFYRFAEAFDTPSWGEAMPQTIVGIRQKMLFLMLQLEWKIKGNEEKLLATQKTPEHAAHYDEKRRLIYQRARMLDVFDELDMPSDPSRYEWAVQGQNAPELDMNLAVERFNRSFIDDAEYHAWLLQYCRSAALQS